MDVCCLQAVGRRWQLCWICCKTSLFPLSSPNQAGQPLLDPPLCLPPAGSHAAPQHLALLLLQGLMADSPNAALASVIMVLQPRQKSDREGLGCSLCINSSVLD